MYFYETNHQMIEIFTKLSNICSNVSNFTLNISPNFDFFDFVILAGSARKLAFLAGFGRRFLGNPAGKVGNPDIIIYNDCTN